MSTEESKKKGYEVTDAQTSPAVASLVVLVLLMVAGFIGGTVFEDIFEATEVKSRPEAHPLTQREKVSGPLVQAHPEVELEAYVESQRHLQTSYGWVDKSREVVRIPIDKAIAMVARDGFPKWVSKEAKLEQKPVPAPEQSVEAEVVKAPTSDGVEAAEQPAGSEAAAPKTGAESSEVEVEVPEAGAHAPEAKVPSEETAAAAKTIDAAGGDVDAAAGAPASAEQPPAPEHH